MSLSYGYSDDPYYVHPKYEEGYSAGYSDGRDKFVDLCDHLGTVIDELGCHILKDEGMTDDDRKMFDLAQAALAKIREVL